MALHCGRSILKNMLSSTDLGTLCPVPHLESVLISRYIGFIDNLRKSSKGALKIVFKSCALNLSTVTGQNVGFLLTKFKKQSLIRGGILED